MTITIRVTISENILSIFLISTNNYQHLTLVVSLPNKMSERFSNCKFLIFSWQAAHPVESSGVALLAGLRQVFVTLFLDLSLSLFFVSQLQIGSNLLKCTWSSFCRSLIKVKFSTDQVRLLLDQAVLCSIDCHHAQKPENCPILDLFNLTPKYFLPLLHLLTIPNFNSSLPISI